MNLPLKSLVWYVLKGSSCKQYAARYRNISCNGMLYFTSQDFKLPFKFQSAKNADDVYLTVQKNITRMSSLQFLHALETLYKLHRAGKFNQKGEKLMRDPAFSSLCQHFRKHTNTLTPNDFIKALKIFSYFKIPAESQIVNTLLSLVKRRINDLNIEQIIFINFILENYDKKNHLVDVLCAALPLAFQIQLPIELDPENLPLLRDMLRFCCSHNLPERCVNNIVTGVLLHNKKIDVETAKSIVWSLCNEQFTCSTGTQLLNTCYDVLIQSIHKLSFDDVKKLTFLLKNRITNKHSEFYNAELMDAISNYVVDNELDFEQSISIVRYVGGIRHTHQGLTKYLCNLVVSGGDYLANCRSHVLFSFINWLSSDNYIPSEKDWQEICRQISLNPIMRAESASLPWGGVCLELASLGYYDEKLITKIFSKEFLKKNLSRDNVVDHILLVKFGAAVNTFYSYEHQLPDYVLKDAKKLHPVSSSTEQLEAHLAIGFGGPEYVTSNVILPNGLLIDTLVCLQGGRPIGLPQKETDSKVLLEELHLPHDGIVLCIMNFMSNFYTMNTKCIRGKARIILDILEKKGYVAIPIHTEEWLKLPSEELTPYLLKEVTYKCRTVGVQLDVLN